MTDKQFLDQFRQKHHEFITHDSVFYPDQSEKERFLSIAKSYNKNYTEDLNCNTCVMSMIDFVYIQEGIKPERIEIRNDQFKPDVTSHTGKKKSNGKA